MSLRDRFSRKEEPKPAEAPQEPQDTINIDLDCVFKYEDRPDPENLTLDDLYPLGAPDYSLTAPESDASYLYQHSVTCPLCHKPFTVTATMQSRLQLKCIEKDMRKRYKNMEPLWYDIWQCPSCNYAAPESHFEVKRDIGLHADEIAASISSFKDILIYTSPRTMNQVITSKYLALLWANFFDQDYTIRAKLWLHLSWLYQDLGDEELFKKATEKALEYYRRLYYTSRKEFDPAVEQVCFLIMAELFQRGGDLKNAYECLIHVRSLKEGKRIYLQDAKDRLADLMEEYHARDKS